MESHSKSNHSHACAACKFQRRKCKPDCPLAPFFPSSSSLDFVAVHKLFGVSNILKALRSFNSPAAKETAVKTMIFQAKARAADPVGGCHRMICHLKNQIQFLENEIQFLRQQIWFNKLVASQLPQFSGDLKEEMSFVDAQQVFDGIPKVENEGLDGELFVISSQSDKSSITVDLSEDRKLLLSVNNDNFNPIFLDSNSSGNSEVLVEEDHESIQLKEEHTYTSLFKMVTVDE